jgi:signal recognition particle receptor subunit beta/GAF domain-containing protein
VVELLHRERAVKVKIVYYGPPVGGKTTNLQVLHQHAQVSRRGEFVSINSAQDRTILFDMLPMRAPGFRGFDIRLQILAVPGQAMYAATRRLVLRGADACVFVANSAADRWQENIQSFQEMAQNLITHQLDPSSLPLVLQYNKRDLPDVTPIDFMDRALNARKVEAIPAVAVRGEGVLETFSMILLRTMQDLATRYQIVEAGKGRTLSQWTQEAVVGMFGTTSLALEPNPLPVESAPPGAGTPGMPPFAPPAPAGVPALEAPEPRPDRRLMRVAMSPEAERGAGAGPDARANESLVESYAQASTQLSGALEEMREQRDVMRRRVEDLQQVLVAAQGAIAGQPLAPTLRAILMRMSAAADAGHASFLLVRPDRALHAVAFCGSLSEDPLLRTPAGRRHLQSRMLGESEPRLHRAADALDLGDALEAVEPRFAAVAVVPIRTPRGLLGLAMLYFTPDAALPYADVLAHLAMISRALSASLELATVLEALKRAERSMQLALSGTASVRGLADVVGFLEALRDEFGAMRKRPDLPPWFLAEFVRLSPGLAGALASARSLVAFNRGQIEKEPVPLEELVADIQTEGVRVQLDAQGAVSGDRVLLRLALKALIDQARGGRASGITVQVANQGGQVRFSLSEPPPAVEVLGGPSPAPHAPPGALALGFVRRVAELHGGSLRVDAAASGQRYALWLLPA